MIFNLFGYELSFGRPKKNPDRQTIYIEDYTGIDYGRRKVAEKPVNRDYLRRFARMPVVRRAINLKKNGLLNLPWRIVKKDPTDKYDYKQEIKVIENCIRNPNNGDSYRSLMSAAIEDIETGDCGAIEVVQSGDMGRPIQLYPVDGFTIQVNTSWNMKPNDVRYLQYDSDKGGYINLLDEDLIYLKNNNFSYSYFGCSSLESAFKTIEYLLNSQAYAGQITSNAIPKFILNLGKQLDDNKINAFRKYFREEIYGTGELPIVGGSEGITTHQLTAINDEGLYLQWQHFLITIIAYTFGLDPKRFNEGAQTDRSTIDEQKENINDEAIKPLAHLFEEGFNKKVIGRVGLGDRLVFEFIYEDTEARKTEKAKRIVLLHDDDLLTINQSLEMLGLPKSDSEYKDMLKSEYKAAVNAKYQIQGGYNGVGKDRYDNVSDKSNTDDTSTKTKSKPKKAGVNKKNDTTK